MESIIKFWKKQQNHLWRWKLHNSFFVFFSFKSKLLKFRFQYLLFTHPHLNKKLNVLETRNFKTLIIMNGPFVWFIKNMKITYVFYVIIYIGRYRPMYIHWLIYAEYKYSSNSTSLKKCLYSVYRLYNCIIVHCSPWPIFTGLFRNWQNQFCPLNYYKDTSYRPTSKSAKRYACLMHFQ